MYMESYSCSFTTCVLRIMHLCIAVVQSYSLTLSIPLQEYSTIYETLLWLISFQDVCNLGLLQNSMSNASWFPVKRPRNKLYTFSTLRSSTKLFSLINITTYTPIAEESSHRSTSLLVLGTDRF